MTDITKALSDLPPFSSPVAYRDTWQAGYEIALQDVMALRAHLALSERLLHGLAAGSIPKKDARVYLQFRKKEQP